MCYHTLTTFSCGHESFSNAKCLLPPKAHNQPSTDLIPTHISEIILIPLDAVCHDCLLGQPREAQEEVITWVHGTDGLCNASVLDDSLGSGFGDGFGSGDILESDFDSGYRSDLDFDGDEYYVYEDGLLVLYVDLT